MGIPMNMGMRGVTIIRYINLSLLTFTYYAMGMGTVMNPHEPMGILWGFLNGCEIKRKRVKYVINVIVDGHAFPVISLYTFCRSALPSATVFRSCLTFQ